MSERDSAEAVPPTWTARIFGASWLSYFSYYFTRKLVSVAKHPLGLSASWLAGIDLGYLIGYAGGQFGAGALGDRLGPRRMVTAGMLASAVLTVAFAIVGTITDSVAPLYLALWSLNGLVQATGWPGNGKLMASWFGAARRGEIMGFWSTCYPAGGVVANLLAGALLGWGWRVMFVGMATWVAAIALGYAAVVRDRPSELGYRDPEIAATLTASEKRAAYRAAWPAIVKNPMTWSLGICYFGLKLVRYGFLLWLPYYLETGSLHYSDQKATIYSVAFDLGGIPFAIVAGELADRVFGRRRVAVACTSALGLVGALALYKAIGETSDIANVGVLALVGAFLFSADSLVSGAAAQDLGGPHAAALACGMINGVGSIGGIAQALLLVPIQETYDWVGVFTMFEIAAVLSFVALIPFFRTRPASANPAATSSPPRS